MAVDQEPHGLGLAACMSKSRLALIAAMVFTLVGVVVVVSVKCDLHRNLRPDPAEQLHFLRVTAAGTSLPGIAVPLRDSGQQRQNAVESVRC